MVDTTPFLDSEKEDEVKIGHKFCGRSRLGCVWYILDDHQQFLLPSISSVYTFKGCCCDSKRAVLVFNILNLIFYIVYIALLIGDSYNIGALWAYYIIGIAIFCFAIAGAALYNRWLVLPAALWAAISLILTIVASVNGSGGTFIINGTAYTVSPVVTIILAVVWQGLVAYVSLVVHSNPFLSYLGKWEYLMLSFCISCTHLTYLGQLDVHPWSEPGNHVSWDLREARGTFLLLRLSHVQMLE